HPISTLFPYTTLFRSLVSETGSQHQTAYHFFRREVFRRKLARGAAVAFVIALDRVHRFQYIVHRLKTEQALAGREKPAEAGLLRSEEHTSELQSPCNL